MNETGGYNFPLEVEPGSVINTIMGVAYLWYTPGYRPLDFTFNLKKVIDNNETLLQQRNFTIGHASVYEFPLELVVGHGENNFVYELLAEHFYQRLTLNVTGKSF